MPSHGDFLLSLAEWLRSTPLSTFSLWLGNQPISAFIDNAHWIMPMAQTIHILAVASLFGSALMINLRILGFAGHSRSMELTIGRYVPWIQWGLVVLLVSGLVITLGDPVREMTNVAFWTKMILVIVSTLASLSFFKAAARNMIDPDSTYPSRTPVRVAAVALTLLWCVIMALGRWIAYMPQ